MIDLKPCSLCGHKRAEVVLAMGEAWVKCACNATSPMMAYADLAISAWNTRPLEDAKDAEIATFRAALAAADATIARLARARNVGNALTITGSVYCRGIG